MIKFLGQMLKLPVAAFVASVETIARAMRDFQKTFDQSVEIVTGVETNLGATSGAGSSIGNAKTETQPNNGNCTNSEDEHMPDPDLSGDDLKIVRYKIIYTERDHERLLEGNDALVNYSTTACDFGARMVNEYMQAHPIEARTLDGEYVSALVELLMRLPKREKEYDRRQVRVLEEIRDRI